MTQLVWKPEEQGNMPESGTFAIRSAAFSPMSTLKHLPVRALFFALGLLIVIGAIWAALNV